jgi:hypothetical protein
VHDLALLLPDGVAPRSDLALASSASSVTRWTAEGHLVQIHPGVMMLSGLRAEPRARARAAALWAQGPLSHLTALAVWEAVAEFPDSAHVTISADRCPRPSKGVIVHRTRVSPAVTTVAGLPVTHLTRSLVDAWSWAHSPRRNPRATTEAAIVRQSVIEAIRDRGVSVTALRAESTSQRLHAGRTSLQQLLDLIAGGCESELEIWGVTKVLPGPPDIPGHIQQFPIRLPTGRWVKADAAFVEAMVIVELDGAAFHGSRAARERDLRRDSALAALGWVVLRFSYARLIADPEGCRSEILAAVRRRLVNR